MNDIVFALDETACDLYLYAIHPAPAAYRERYGQAFREMLELYDDANGWLPASSPVLNKTVAPLSYLEGVLPLLALASDDMRPLTACADRLKLPAIPDPKLDIADDMARENLAAIMREVPLFPIVDEELSHLQALSQALATVEMPQLSVNAPRSLIINPLSGQIADLQDETRQFFVELMLPMLVDN
jgi:hypothetical protein